MDTVEAQKKWEKELEAAYQKVGDLVAEQLEEGETEGLVSSAVAVALEEMSSQAIADIGQEEVLKLLSADYGTDEEIVADYEEMGGGDE